MSIITVPLTKPIVGHSAIHELRFREPKWSDYIAVGEAYVWAMAYDGQVRPTPLVENVGKYAERLILSADGSPGNPLVLGQVSLGDSMAVRDAICDFFLAVDPRVDRSKTSDATSSSSSDGAPQTSAT